MTMVATIDTRAALHMEQESIRTSQRVAQVVQVSSSLRKLAVLDVLLAANQPMTIAGISEMAKATAPEVFKGMEDTTRHNLVDRLLFQLEADGFLNQTRGMTGGSPTENSLTDLGGAFLPLGSATMRSFFEYTGITELFRGLKEDAIEDIVDVLLSSQRTLRRGIYTIPEDKLIRSTQKHLGAQESESTRFIEGDRLTDNGVRLADAIGSLGFLVERAERMAASSYSS